MQLSTGGQQFSWRFLQAEVTFPTIGADFLANFKMVVDLSGLQLLCPAGLKILLEVHLHFPQRLQTSGSRCLIPSMG